MPRVPTVIPRRAIPVAPGVRQSAAGASAAAFGAGTGQALQRLGQVGINAANALEKREQEDIAEQRVARAQEAYNNYRRDAAALLRHPESGLLFKNGKDAAGGTEFFQKQSEALRAKYSADLDESERRLFDRAHTSFSRPAVSSLQSHEATQSRVYKQGQSKDLADGAQADAMELFNDEEGRLEAEARLLGAIQNTARLKGEDVVKEDGTPSEFVKKHMLLATTKIYQEGINRYLAIDQPEEANRLFKENEHKIHPSAKDDLIKALRSSGLAKRSQTISDNAFAKFGRSEGKGLAWIRRNYSGDAETQALQEFRARHVDRRRDETNRRNDHIRSVSATIMNTPDSAEALAIANRQTDPEVKQAARALVLAQFRLEDTLEGRARTEAFEAASVAILDDNTPIAESKAKAQREQDPVVKNRSLQLIQEEDRRRKSDKSDADKAAYKAFLGKLAQADARETVTDSAEFTTLQGQNILDARSAVSKQFAPPKLVKTADTVAANLDLELAIDIDAKLPQGQKRFKDVQDLRAAMAVSKLPPDERGPLEEYRQTGGAAGKITTQMVAGIILSRGGKIEDFPDIAKRVREQFIPGKESLGAQLEAIVANEMLQGTLEGTGFFRDTAVSRFEAERRGQTDIFIPTIREDNRLTPQARQAVEEINALIAGDDPRFNDIKATDKVIQLYIREREFGEASSKALGDILPQARDFSRGR